MIKNWSLSIFIFFSILLSSSSTFAQSIRFNLGGAKYTAVTTRILGITISVDTLTPTVVTGTAADQSFRDDTVGAAFFGYYLTAGVRTQGQPAGTVGNLKLKRGATETSGRTYYLLGNGTTTPTAQSNLTLAPNTLTTFATMPRNSTRCGPNWAANGVSGVNGVNCGPNPTVANMNLTQFVKVLFTDLPTATIISSLEFVVVEE
jgi:hypothetical protein